MGEAKRKAKEWVQLYPGLPVRCAISRPHQRLCRQYENEFAARIAAALAAGRPTLCFNFECDNELHALPAVIAFLRTTDDPRTPPIVMGVCESCAKRSDETLREMMRRGIGRKYGFDGPPEGCARVEMTAPTYLFSVEGLQIAVVQPEVFTDNPICLAAARFANLLEDHLLPRFMAFRHGFGNCHGIVHQLRRDLKAIGLEHLFSFKRGSSGALKTATDREGLHSWLETDGWVIDASNGASGRPVLVVPTGEYYANMQMTEISDTPEQTAEEQFQSLEDT